MTRIVLDTNAYVALRRGDVRVLGAIGRAERVSLPVFVAGELLYGFKMGTQELLNRRELESFMEEPEVRALHTTSETADVFAGVKARLREKVRPMPENDLWIAALCLETGSTLVSFDRHFNHVDGLRIWIYGDTP